jgi:predicted hydrolase (HD superfamily)
MSRKHYTLLAHIIRQETTMKQLARESLDEERELVRHLCNLLGRDYENFDRNKFTEACGI